MEKRMSGFLHRLGATLLLGLIALPVWAELS
jgi:hypothetical protein